MNNIGYIYKITNNINKHSYVGQTQYFYEIRWKEHKTRYNNENSKSYNISLYKAFRKYGIENFSFEVIEECEHKKLDEREIFWIKYYDTFHNGYNETLGGSGSKIYEIDETLILSLYEKYKTINKVVLETKYNKSIVSAVLKKNNIYILQAQEHQKNKGKHIMVYSLDKTLIKKFNSRSEVGEWLLLMKLSNAKNAMSAGYTVVYKLNNNIHLIYDLIWFYEHDNNIKNFHIDEKSLSNNNINKSTKNTCPICGGYKNSKSQQCINCYNKNKIKKSKIVSKEVLEQDLAELSFVEIGKKYGVSDNAIRKWCKKYNLPYKKYKLS